jgi:3-oxoacyl-[acyl-carrier-protein] synthase-3
MSKIAITDISYFVPTNKVTNEDIINNKSLSEPLKMKADFVSKRIGIDERRWSNANTSASDLAVEACKKINLNNFSGSLWVSTISQDFLTPSTASIIKQKLNIKNDSPAYDLNSACAGQIFALDAAHSRLKSHDDENESLIIATEMRSKFLNPSDRRTVFLFADGACSIKLSKVDDSYPGEVEWIISKTIASQEYEIYIPGGGSKKPLTNESLANGEQYIKMNDGSAIFQATTESLVEEINSILDTKKILISDYDFFIFHQGNGAIIKKVCEKIGVSLNKTHINFNKFGNTSSASMGIAMAEAVELGKIKTGDKVLAMAMGAGYHIGLMSLIWGEV